MRDRKLVEQAQALSRAGLKNVEIAKKLNKSTSNISRWCRKEFMITRPTINSSYQEKMRYYLFSNNPVKIRYLSKNLAQVLLSVLYWCEGAKYPGTSRIEFVSSDENMQVVFIKLLRKVFAAEIDESKFRVMLQLHSSHNIPTTTKRWSKLLDVPTTQFIKPHITIGKNTRYRHAYNGTCALRYHNYRFLLRIMGNYDQVANQIIHQLV